MLTIRPLGQNTVMMEIGMLCQRNAEQGAAPDLVDVAVEDLAGGAEAEVAEQHHGACVQLLRDGRHLHEAHLQHRRGAMEASIRSHRSTPLSQRTTGASHDANQSVTM